MTCGCHAAPTAIRHPEHRPGRVRQGAVGPELAQGAGARAQALIPGISGAVAQALNGVRSRRSTADLAMPLPLPRRGGLGDVDVDGPGTQTGRPSSAGRLPPGWWALWDGEAL